MRVFWFGSSASFSILEERVLVLSVFIVAAGIEREVRASVFIAVIIEIMANVVCTCHP
jgi:hypothetical protein